MAEAATSNKKQKAINVHEIFASNLAFENNILWDFYTPRQFSLFKDKLKELFRDPEPEQEPEPGSENHDNNNRRKRKAMEKIRQAVYDSTISQTKYTNKNLLATFILVTVAEGTQYVQARDATKFSIHLITRTRKCMNDDDSSKCCMVFIDELGSVYKNWNHFIETNTLPEGVVLAPSNGVYKYENGKLELDAWTTPSSGLGSQILAKTDVAAGVGGFAAAAITISAAALSAPISAPILAGAGVVCAGTGIYSAIRSGYNLWSRKDHEQSIALTDGSARGSWLGVAGGALAITSSIANKSLAQLVIAGQEVTLMREVVVNGMNISTMLLSGSGVANGILDLYLKYTDDEEISGLDVLQVAASLAIFTHSAYNFRLASTIVTQVQDAKVNSYRTELSNRQRKMFDKMTKESIRTQGGNKGKMDVIRLINEVPDKQYLNDLNKVNKDLNKNKVRFRAGTNGHISLNDDIQVKAADLRSSVQHGQGENILGKVNNPIPQSHETITNQKTVNTLTSNAFSENSINLVSYVQTALKVALPLILNQETFQNCVQNLITNVGETVAQYLIRKSRDFLERYGPRIEQFIRTTLYLEIVLWDLYLQCEQTFLTFTVTLLEEKMPEIFENLLKYYEQMSCKNSSKKLQCDVCKGFYQICPI